MIKVEILFMNSTASIIRTRIKSVGERSHAPGGRFAATENIEIL